MSAKLLRKADTYLGRVRGAVNRAIDTGRRKVSLGRLEASARMRDAHDLEYQASLGIEAMLRHLEDTLPSLLYKILAAGGTVAASEFPNIRLARRESKTKANPPSLKFDIKNPEAIAWAREHAGELIADLSIQQRDTLRQIISAALSEGIAPRDVALVIRGSIGLNQAQAEALLSLNAKLLDSPGKIVRAGQLKFRVPAEGIGRQQLDHALTRYAERLRKTRATMIARTEIIEASNEGQRQFWSQAQRKGLLSDRVKREWIATPGACPICRALDGKTAPVTGPFPGGKMRPPAHPFCRCTTGLKY